MKKKLTGKQVSNMWMDWKSGGSYKDIAEQYGISKRKAKRIVGNYHRKYESGELSRKFYEWADKVKQTAETAGLEVTLHEVCMYGWKAINVARERKKNEQG